MLVSVNQILVTKWKNQTHWQKLTNTSFFYNLSSFFLLEIEIMTLWLTRSVGCILSTFFNHFVTYTSPINLSSENFKLINDSSITFTVPVDDVVPGDYQKFSLLFSFLRYSGTTFSYFLNFLLFIKITFSKSTTIS